MKSIPNSSRLSRVTSPKKQERFAENYNIPELQEQIFDSIILSMADMKTTEVFVEIRIAFTRRLEDDECRSAHNCGNDAIVDSDIVLELALDCMFRLDSAFYNLQDFDTK